ncbi:MAG: chemotaxis response regulator protein-glutamate methylesterase [Sphingomonas sp.]|nr:MAG: chemotaxis response regulator protein-glutamate methylesterase [Sphingomonas sp.]
MVVDDSIVARAVLVRLLQNEPDIAVVAEANSGRSALAALAVHRPDLTLLDLEMPDMGGLEALPEIIERGGGRVMVVSSACGEGASASIHALRLGAADTLLKPGAGALAGSFARDLVEKIRRIAAEPSDLPKPGPRPLSIVPDEPARPAAPRPAQPRARGIDCVAIGASTGGVHALAAFFAALPRSVAAPILVTQHLPAPFMPYFVDQLQEMSGRPTKLACDGMQLASGGIILAPGDAHIGLARTRGIIHIKLERRRMPSGCTPSVDPMLTGVADVFGAGGLAVILSGMGRDGVLGAADLVAAGGEVLAQDAGSSVVWGMPGAVVTGGLARIALPPAALAREVAGRIEIQGAGAWI